MDRKLASIRRISTLNPIKGADRIELARIDGWDVIVKKSQFQVGDLCVYCEIDSILPDRPEFEFLRDKGFRIKTMKMRGVISQGIVFPLDILPAWEKDCGCPYEWEEGKNVTEILDIKLYDQEEEGVFPHFIPKTKEERVQNLSDFLSDMVGLKFIATEKLDGMSVTYYLKDGDFRVCSRNCELEFEKGGHYSEIANKYDIESVMRRESLVNFAIQGEIIGPKIHKNRLKLDEALFYVFHVFDIDNQEFLDWNETIKLVESMDLKIVPVIDIDFNIEPFTTVDQIIEKADGKSIINPEVRREGMVIRSLDVHECQFSKLSFKVVSNKYLLKKGK